MKIEHVIAALAPLLLGHAGQATAQAPSAPPRVSTERMSEMTRVLASDDFEGRSMGTRGEERTVAYLVKQFRAAGLEPGGENNGWTQTVPMIRTKLGAPMRFSVRDGGVATPLRFPDDIYLSTVPVLLLRPCPRIECRLEF